MSSSAAPSNKWLALALLATAQFVIVLDASIVNVALPSIGKDLDFSQDDLSWVVNAYTLIFGGFLLLGGRLADLLGRRLMFISGLLLFALASLAGGFAQSELWLIIARAVQGLGAALVSPAALSIVTTTFKEGAERNTALGVWGAVAGSGGAAGVLLGGVLTEWAGWEWVLFVNVPVGALVAVMSLRTLLESRKYSGVISPHGWMDPGNWPRLWKLGGLAFPGHSAAAQYVEEWKTYRPRSTPYACRAWLPPSRGPPPDEPPPRCSAPSRPDGATCRRARRPRSTTAQPARSRSATG